ncbi:hypothetical protein PTTG_31120, partial [Puccinia triticina 1-1 BBBD Race 1]
MTTQSNPDELLPITDPEAILRAANAAKRKAKLEAQKKSDLEPYPPSNPLMSSSGSTTPKADDKKPVSLEYYLEGLMKLQHQSIDQANADRATALEMRKADADQIARLEETIMTLSTKKDKSGRIDLATFRYSDGPVFVGPFKKVEPFINWLQGVENFFDTKGVTHDDDKLRIVGNFFRETNTSAFYAGNIKTAIGKPWTDFKTKLLSFALPPSWRTNLRANLKNLQMTNTETFLSYSTRARTLQTMMNFDVPENRRVSDFTLAEAMTLGMTDDLQTEVNNHRLLIEEDEFEFNEFEGRAGVFWDGIAKRRANRQ